MGGHTFTTTVQAASAAEAYRAECERSRSEYGTDPYNGTISTTRGYSTVSSADFETWDRDVCSEEARAIEERYGIGKWGNAGVIDRGDGTYTLFGWAAE